MPEKLALLISSATPDRPETLATPLVHALAALALDAEVEIHFAGPAVRWLVQGVAEQAWPTPAREKSLAVFLAEAHAAGARLYTCSMATAAWVGADEAYAPWRHGSAGATAFIARSLDPAWQTLVY